MKYKIGQICYMTNGFSGFLKSTGLKLPLKCKVESYNQLENNYDVLVIEPKPEVNYHEMSDGNFLRMGQRHSLIGVDPKNLVGSV